MLTNELKKGDRIRLNNGWYATIEDNRKGNIRLATVEGYVTEIGSIYAWDIACKLAGDTMPMSIELTQDQIKARAKVRAWGF